MSKIKILVWSFFIVGLVGGGLGTFVNETFYLLIYAALGFNTGVAIGLIRGIKKNGS